MEDIKERILPVFVALLMVAVVGICGYSFIEGWGLLDATYMTVITLAGVGYGETHPLSDTGRMFTICLILFGMGVLAYAISTLTAFIVEGTLKDAWRRKRMEAKIAKLSGHYIICGTGHTGEIIMQELKKTRRPFVVVDKDAARIEELQKENVFAIVGDAIDDEVLRKAGIERARGLFGALPSDPDNAFMIISARGLNPKLRIVCQQIEVGSTEKLRRSGADAVISPGSIGGLRMASEMIRPATVGFLDAMLRAEHAVFRIEEVVVPADSPLCGEPISAVKGAEGGAALLLAVKQSDSKSYDINPSSSKTIKAGEVLVVMGNLDDLQTLENRLGISRD